MTLSRLGSTLALLAAALPPPVIAQAPAGSSETRYCMRVEPPTGSRIERIRCWTRAEWERRGVDLDADWPREGVRTID